MMKIESLCKALRCVGSQDSEGDCYKERHNLQVGLDERGEPMVACTSRPPKGYITCPYYQDDYGVCAEDGELSWLTEVANYIEYKSMSDNCENETHVMRNFKEILRCRIENALDEGFAKHIPLTSEYLAEKLLSTPLKDEKMTIERGLAAKIIQERVQIDEDMVLGEPQSDFDKWVEEQDTAMRLAVVMLLDPVKHLTPEELRHAYVIEQHECDKLDIENELECAAEYYNEKFHIDEKPVTENEIERMAFELRKLLDKDADACWSYCRAEAVSTVLRRRNKEVDE